MGYHPQEHGGRRTHPIPYLQEAEIHLPVPTLITSVPATVFTYVDTTVTLGITYLYYISAESALGGEGGAEHCSSDNSYQSSIWAGASTSVC